MKEEEEEYKRTSLFLLFCNFRCVLYMFLGVVKCRSTYKPHRPFKTVEPKKLTRKFYKNNFCALLGDNACIKKKSGIKKKQKYFIYLFFFFSSSFLRFFFFFLKTLLLNLTMLKISHTGDKASLDRCG